ncbi:pyridoxal phosphate-dependent transferase [Ochromonadaceae sp. CCMP2298]|nr:pyridoxal phosphate-dependent transferase [Ochromonadaceae sp. CCMP2298]
MPGPSWVSYPAQAEMLQKKTTFVQTTYEEGWKVNPQNLSCLKADSCENKLLFLNYPSNPTGLSFSREELSALASLLKETGTVALCDEIYQDTHFEQGEQAPSLAQVLPAQSIICSGFSKSFAAGGWRLGYFVFPPELSHICKAMASLASETYSCAPTPMQYAALDSLTQLEDPASPTSHALSIYHLKQRLIMHKLGSLCTSLLNKARIRTHTPDGGFYIFPDFHHHMGALKARGVTDGGQLCRQILSSKAVTLLPSEDFRVAGDDLQVRLCFVHFDGAAALEACPLPVGTGMGADGAEGEIDEAWLRAHCGDVVTGVERICEWADELYK